MAYSRQDLSKDIYQHGTWYNDVELDPGHINLAITMAFDRYRQRSQKCPKKIFLVYYFVARHTDIHLTDEVMEVKTFTAEICRLLAAGARPLIHSQCPISILSI